MNTCIKCQRPIPDGDLFCAECSKAPAATQKKTAGLHAGRFQKPRFAPAEKTAPSPKPRAGRVPLVVLSVLLAVFLGISVYFFATVSSQKIALRLREASARAKEQKYSELEQSVSDLNAQLDALEAELSRKNDQIRTLSQTVSSAESSASQTEYDLQAQKNALEKLQQQYDSLKESYAQLVTEYDSLADSVSEMNEKAKFMDDYVVFVENDGSGYFHKYDCDRFAKKTFWAYSRRLAETSGFGACPYCMDE